jgi:Ca-activated chloride channel family protein
LKERGLYRAVSCCLLIFAGCGKAPEQMLIMGGNFYSSQERYTEAIAAYLNAGSYSDAAPYSDYGLGTVYQRLDEKEAAMERFNAAQERLGGSSDADKELLYRIAYNQGILYFEEEDFAAAADSFRRALELNGGRVEAKRNLELSLLSINRQSSGGAALTAQVEVKEEAAESKTLFDYLRRKEEDQWKNRIKDDEELPSWLDY